MTKGWTPHWEINQYRDWTCSESQLVLSDWRDGKRGGAAVNHGRLRAAHEREYADVGEGEDVVGGQPRPQRHAPVHDDVADDPNLPEGEPVAEEPLGTAWVEVVLVVLGQRGGGDRACVSMLRVPCVRA